MVQAYRSGLLRPGYAFKWGSRIREAWLLRSIEQENDAAQARDTLQFKAAFAPILQNPGKLMEETLKLQEALGRYIEGDPTALLYLQKRTEHLSALQELWQAMTNHGILGNNAHG